ncbi:MAG TPA: hypothetical protein VFF86_06305, partial [Candidatus Methylomirabilis sp.]|nr:hypothetical protein [Candidatus Methylomirabilis sp.]
GRLARLSPRVTTSARKWEQERVLKTILLMWTIRLLYFVGVAPERLHRWYYCYLPSPSRGESGGSSVGLFASNVRK